MMAKRICTIHASKWERNNVSNALEFAEVGSSLKRSRIASPNNTAPEVNMTRRMRFARRGSDGIRKRPAVTIRMPQNRRDICSTPCSFFTKAKCSTCFLNFFLHLWNCASRVCETQDVNLAVPAPSTTLSATIPKWTFAMTKTIVARPSKPTSLRNMMPARIRNK